MQDRFESDDIYQFCHRTIAEGAVDWISTRRSALAQTSLFPTPDSQLSSYRRRGHALQLMMSRRWRLRTHCILPVVLRPARVLDVHRKGTSRFASFVSLPLLVIPLSSLASPSSCLANSVIVVQYIPPDSTILHGITEFFTFSSQWHGCGSTSSPSAFARSATLARLFSTHRQCTPLLQRLHSTQDTHRTTPPSSRISGQCRVVLCCDASV
ncbi:hypothetical protein C8R45DRAFT_1032077 [Mycena sanguinolenta]|nr:hypothetical protein C8R45DRAFT_1032077 [Mycena sanguinolenta]